MTNLACCVGDKEPFVCQSDDQFFVNNYAIQHGLSVTLTRHPIPYGADAWIDISVPALELFRCSPFDYQLHQVADQIRKELRHAGI